MIDSLLFGIFPYVALAIALVGAIWRYTANRYSYSSLSSQFLEGRQLFYGSFPWHFGIIALLIGHLLGVLMPSAVRAWNGVPLRLYILEGTALALGLMALAGLVVLIIRRGTNPRVRHVTSVMDVALLAVLLVQVIAGVGTAIFHRWGSFWFLDSATPYLWSLIMLGPRPDYLAPLPFLVKLHALNAFVLIAILPFTRLVHMLSLPVTYLWRPYQLVRWNWGVPRVTEK